jgi:predicted DNA-binding transcriptional regulator AlpA
MNDNVTPGWRLYRIPEAMRLLSMSRSVIYEQIRAGRLRGLPGPNPPHPRLGDRGVRRPLDQRVRASVMTARRSRGDGGLHWHEGRQRWVASVTVGYTPTGKRIVRQLSAKTKTEAKNRLKEILRDHEDGVSSAVDGYTVAQTVEDWLAYGLAGQSANTVTNRRILAETHIVGPLGARKLRDLSADDVDAWLADRAKILSTSTLQRVKSILSRAVARAQARDKVRRNVVLLCGTPTGKGGRPSKALTLAQAMVLLEAAEKSSLKAYLIVSLLTGARTEELRALTWSHVDLDGDPGATPPVVPHVMVWRSVREDGDTKDPEVPQVAGVARTVCRCAARAP